MISIGKLRSADYYQREVVDGAEDYYVASGEAPGRWVGYLAAELGLRGDVDADQLHALFQLRNPHTGEALLASRATKPGFDLTISAPKSVSVLWALGDAGTSSAVVASMWSAVEDSKRFFEANACAVRRGHAGAEVQDGAGFVGAAFLHRTSRLADPGLHVHLLVINATHGPDGAGRLSTGVPCTGSDTRPMPCSRLHCAMPWPATSAACSTRPIVTAWPRWPASRWRCDGRSASVAW